MKKNGFTLIELLAVIVVLAVIALIATPLIMGVIANSQKGAAKDSAYAIIKAAELEMAKGTFSLPVSYTEDSDLNYRGTKPTKMSLEIDEAGKTSIAAYIDGYCVVKDSTQEEVTIDESKKNETDCVAEVRNNIMIDVKEGMIPVVYDANGNPVKADIDQEWYNYDAKKWANAVVVTSSSRENYLKAGANTIIQEADILGYYVYIPRYKYQLWNVNNEAKPEQEIKIVFERRSKAKSTGTKNGEWLTHPAFTFGTSELNGIWVGKFEMTGTNETPTIKPNQKSLTAAISSDQNVAGAFKTIKSMQSNSYGISSYDSHMMKNMEWGAIAYLTQSKYGRCTNGTCTEVWINNVNTGTGQTTGVQWGPSITGCSGTSASAEVKNNMTSCEAGRDYKQAGVNASTTGNITGIYDMSGGAWERTLGFLIDSNKEPIYSASGFNASNMPDLKYFDAYTITTGDYDYTKGKLGDATREIIKTTAGNTAGWYDDRSYMPVVTGPWFYRGGSAHLNSEAGLFAIYRASGGNATNNGSRAVVVYE